MNRKKFAILAILIILITSVTNLFFYKHILALGSSINSEEDFRNDPPYEVVMGKDYLPHFRLLFWVPEDAEDLVPYSDKDIDTDVSSHGPAEKWSVVETSKTRDNKKLVYIYVPKTFVIMKGPKFYKYIHIKFVQ